eukprot:TRINITY_DN7433_c0_g1_i1.p1 TRINITY_DN7433_c0_g1~~TRINITY_DN7433_c0_g1_i1.p1  ORF type:complete len:529 (-),score=81.42 TRINITY_DN7433_c0_g1_i1:161-1717(-)
MMWTRLLLGFVLAVARVVGDDSLVQLPGGGSIQGKSFERFRSFLGIPFAQPPLGALRFAEPVAAPNWTGVKNALAFGPDCPQWSESDEDCLYLNVWAPRASKGANLPVLFWFYGGCWEQGTTSDSLYNGEHLVSHEQDVIVVSSNYRLGPFGFLGSASLAAESPTGTTGNYGLLDQRLALQWVQENIAAFGGDKTRVTIFGQSAGSGSVANHLIMPKSFGLYHAAIMESGPFADWIAKPMEVSQQQFDATVAKLGCNVTGYSDAQVLACLRNLTSAQIQHSKIDCATTCCYYPTIDGVEISEKPATLAAAGRFNRVPMMLGTTTNEGSSFITPPHNMTDDEYKTYLLQTYGSHYLDQLLQLYPASDYKSPWWAACAIWTHSSMTCPARRSARWIAGNGGTVYQYYWTHVIEETAIFAPYMGAFHGVEIPFVFHLSDGDYHSIPVLLTPEEVLLQDRISNIWTHFGATGNPNPSGSEWPPFNNNDQQNMELNNKFTVQSYLFKTLCDFWDIAQNYTSVV